MMRSYKTEINPTPEQKQIINRTIGVCRYTYNFYLGYNKEVYANGGEFINGMDFSKWLNNEYLPNNPEYLWIKEVYAKSVKQSIMNADRAFKRFFNKKSKFPKFKKKNKSDVKMYFVKNDAKMVIECERRRNSTLVPLRFITEKLGGTIIDFPLSIKISSPYPIALIIYCSGELFNPFIEFSNSVYLLIFQSEKL